MTGTKQIAVISKDDERIKALDKVIEDYAVTLADKSAGQMLRAAVVGRTIVKLRDSIGEIMPTLKALQNTSIGFLTDRKDGYDDDTLKTVAIESLIHGVQLTGNEFNIIRGRFYITQAGFAAKLRKTEGLSDLDVKPGTPVMKEGSASVRIAADWKYNDVRDRLTDHEGKPGRVFTVQISGPIGPDAVIGKALRKAYKAIYEKIHGSDHTIPDAEVIDVPIIESEVKPSTGSASDLMRNISEGKSKENQNSSEPNDKLSV
jgi:hypothetical protein